VQRDRVKMFPPSPVCVIFSKRDNMLHVAAPAERDIGIAFYDEDLAYQHFEVVPAGEERDLDVSHAYFALTDMETLPLFIPAA
jgi:hypothetical protein